MARDPRRAKRLKIQPDEKFQSVVVSKFIGKFMLDGKRSVAQRLFYSAMDIIAEKTKKDPITVFEEALRNASPSVQVKSRRVGGANYQIPVEVSPVRRTHYGMVWLREAARSRTGKSFDHCLAEEFMDAANGMGAAVRKKEDTHKMAEANKAFAHFARY
jgi:small subunit ribosomal protein S7